MKDAQNFNAVQLRSNTVRDNLVGTCINTPATPNLSNGIATGEIAPIRFDNRVPNLLHLPFVQINETANGFGRQGGLRLLPRLGKIV